MCFAFVVEAAGGRELSGGSWGEAVEGAAGPWRHLGGPGGIWRQTVFKTMCFISKSGATDHFA